MTAHSGITSSVRVLIIGGRFSYLALFNWVRPDIYIGTMIGVPVFQILFFTKLGRFTGAAGDEFFIIGNALQTCAIAGLYAMTMVLANERAFGTLPALLATPANRLALFLGRTFPVVVNGIFVAGIGLTAGVAVFGLNISLSRLPALALVLVVTACSCTGFGLLLGSLAMRARDVLFVPNLAYYLMLLVCGANVRLASLPAWLRAVGQALPLTRGIAAGRFVVAGAPVSAVSGLIIGEALVGVAYATAGYWLLRLFEAEGRRRASLETI